MNCQKRDNLTKLENVKNGQVPENKESSLSHYLFS